MSASVSPEPSKQDPALALREPHPYLDRFRLLTTIMMLAHNWDRLSPHDARALTQKALSHFDAGLTLTREERRAVSAALRRIANAYDDMSSNWRRFVPVGAWGGIIVAAAGAIGRIGLALPVEFFGLAIAVGVVAVTGGIYIY